ncbi:hypothetical protein PCE1_001379 [Barthelona sp. PCE]
MSEHKEEITVPDTEIEQSEEPIPTKTEKKAIDWENFKEEEDYEDPMINGLTLMERFNLCRSVGEEITEELELFNLLKHKPEPIAYDGFEPSGRIHIAQGLMKVLNVNKLTKAGCRFVFYVADWFALMNNKCGGDLKKIQKVGQYFIEVWKSLGMDMERVDFVWASDFINDNSNEYWLRVMDIARGNTLARVKRCSTIMGRQAADSMPAAQIMYPCMQAADIFELKADICQLGMDQRKVNMLARDYCDSAKIRFKPVIISHHMLLGLGGETKASKSVPDSAIFMDDDEATVNRKVRRAFCEIGNVTVNPVLDYMQHIIFPYFPDGVMVERKERDGGDIFFSTYEEMHAAYVSEELHPGDLKPALSKHLNQLLQPVRDHFRSEKKLKKLLGFVKKVRSTR